MLEVKLLGFFHYSLDSVGLDVELEASVKQLAH